jgi:hypothetical protein
VFALIAGVVSSELSHLVLMNNEVPESSLPYCLWSNIKLYFSPNSKKNITKLKCQFFTSKIKEDEDIKKFASRVNCLANQLNAIIGKGQKSRISHISDGNHLAVIIEGNKCAFPEAYNAVSQIKGIRIEQAISFLTTNCMKLQSWGGRINTVRAKPKEATRKKKCNHCSWIGHTAKYCWDLHPELHPKQGNTLMVQHNNKIPIM